MKGLFYIAEEDEWSSISKLSLLLISLVVNIRVLLIVLVRSVPNGDDLSEKINSVVVKCVSECDIEESIDVLELIEVSVDSFNLIGLKSVV